MTTADVVVVGGGPAGSSTARALTGRGFDVVVLDKREFPRDKVCAGWITPAVVEATGMDLGDYAAGRLLQPINAFRIGVLGSAEVETRRSAEPISYGFRRCELDDYLLRASGARLRLGEPLTSLERQGDGWLVNGEIRAPLLVGAGGHFCPVARHLGASVGRDETAILAQEIEVEMSDGQAAACSVAAAVPQLLFCPDLRGYGWAFRKGGWLNVGLGREDPERLAEHVAAFRSFLIDDGRIPADVPTRFKGHAYRLSCYRPRRVVDDGVLLVGDAAGLAYPKSGEGIRPAVESGLMAAAVVAEAGGDYSAARLAPYADAVAERFGLGRRVRDGGDGPGAMQRLLASRLFGAEWFARRVVQDRWFLHRHEPALAAG